MTVVLYRDEQGTLFRLFQIRGIFIYLYYHGRQGRAPIDRADRDGETQDKGRGTNMVYSGFVQ